MKLPFLDREDEKQRLLDALEAEEPSLAVVYGRRRCGKSRLLQQVLRPRDVYFLADQRETPLQIEAFSAAVERVLPGFAAARYGTWDRLLTALSGRVTDRLNLVVDEFPYLVQSAPELPSLLQRFIDQPGPKRLGWVLCGSSQRMMQNVVLDRSAPLYGRARQILKIRPLKAGWCMEALNLKSRDAVEAFSVWGGVPRYWELARMSGTTREALASLVLDRHGVLHEEPQRLLLEEMRSAVQASSLLSLIGAGCHRLSEIAGRLGKPAGSLTRPLNNLMELGYIRKDRPWDAGWRTSRRTLHVIEDPFLRFYYRFVTPNLSLLESGQTDRVFRDVCAGLTEHTAAVWEDLVRSSVPFSTIGGQTWRTAARWWGHDTNGRMTELDVVAESEDRGTLLIGECKWGRVSPSDPARWLTALKSKAQALPFVGKRSVIHVLWLRQSVDNPGKGIFMQPEDVLRALH